ncbi:hypothetical protein RN70_02445 [Staphylococcus schleiferi]|uniref:Uncharacterized protein n=2 Tax=Staphylococcus TaxID=1279 RepID=A0A9X0PCN7_9STAP|nr:MULTISPECIES: hypothetical protein [Staphylococcus]QGS46192.1 hypothetical protein FOB90_05605 [Mammaliicoccus fleurettii]AKS66340.1 hypothetical protein LH95_02160 [Staphylococcus schleiferi]AKS68458.1 hypothetical protein NP71_02250 [Staphylococcus schleiferi]AKS70687.1 hypothetical protein OA96_02135 [Staphylococcus schleiferi]AKS72856.1 hypothetical protein RN70_02445 [Staphylococcus schleiferi]
MRKAILELIRSNQSCYEIYIHTGVSQGIISDIRSGYRTLDDISLRDAERLYDYAQLVAA